MDTAQQTRHNGQHSFLWPSPSASPPELQHSRTSWLLSYHSGSPDFVHPWYADPRQIDITWRSGERIILFFWPYCRELLCVLLTDIGKQSYLSSAQRVRRRTGAGWQGVCIEDCGHSKSADVQGNKIQLFLQPCLAWTTRSSVKTQDCTKMLGTHVKWTKTVRLAFVLQSNEQRCYKIYDHLNGW